MITFEDVKRGYERKVVTFCNGKQYSGFNEIVCRIGHKGWNYNWFYFGGSDTEYCSDPVSFLNDVGIDNALEWVTNALNESIYVIDPEEYAFYESVLNEYKEETC